MKRGFQVVTKYQKDRQISLPRQATSASAGYDLASAVDMWLPSVWKLNFVKVLWAIRSRKRLSRSVQDSANRVLRPYLIPTGIKAFMPSDEFLMIANRSSNPLKRRLMIPNGIGIVDADYYNNPTNEGELFVQMVNFGVRDYHVAKGDRIAQAIFMPCLRAGNVLPPKRKRRGGFGSSGK